MGRPVFYRQRIRNQALSVQAKSLLTHLASEIRARREISPEEAWLIALDAQNYLEQGLLELGPGQIELPCLDGLDSHFRKPRRNQAEKLIRLTVIAEEDTHLLEEFGTRIMQQGRLARLLEEALEQGALLDGNRLCLLMPLTLAAIRERLSLYWQQGVKLPLAGMTRENRQKLKTPRAVLAIERYLAGEELTHIRRELAVSRLRWNHWWRGFQESAACLEDGQAATHESCPLEWVTGWQEVWHTYRDRPEAKERLGKPVRVTQTPPPADAEELLWQRLIHDHGYTPAAARQFMQELRDLALRLKQLNRYHGQIITFGVAADEPPRRSLSEARLCLVPWTT